MNWLTLAFDQPLWLLLLLGLPVVAWMSRKSLASMGRGRQAMAIVLRCAVLTVLVFALAEIQLVRITERIAAYFLLDQSFSLTAEQRDAVSQYAAAATAAHQDARLRDAAGLIVLAPKRRWSGRSIPTRSCRCRSRRRWTASGRTSPRLCVWPARRCRKTSPAGS